METGKIIMSEWFSYLTSSGVFFVTRLKKDADYTVLKRYSVPKKGKITSDQRIRIHKNGLILRLANFSVSGFKDGYPAF